MQHEAKSNTGTPRPRSAGARGADRDALQGMEVGGRKSAVQRGGAASAERRAATHHRARQGCRGGDSAKELERLLPEEQHLAFVEFMESLHVEGLDLSREPDYGRDVEL